MRLIVIIFGLVLLGILVYFSQKSEASPVALIMVALRYLAARQLASQGAAATVAAVTNLGTKEVVKLATGIYF
jgi:hypothetical protein